MSFQDHYSRASGNLRMHCSGQHTSAFNIASVTNKFPFLIANFTLCAKTPVRVNNYLHIISLKIYFLEFTILTFICPHTQFYSTNCNATFSFLLLVFILYIHSYSHYLDNDFCLSLSSIYIGFAMYYASVNNLFHIYIVTRNTKPRERLMCWNCFHTNLPFPFA